MDDPAHHGYDREGNWPGYQYGQNDHQYGQSYYGTSGKQEADRAREEKRKKLKQTRTGLGLLLGAITCMILSLLAAPVICINSILGLGTLGLGISAFIMMLLGANAIEKPHRTLLIISLVIIIIAYLVTMVLAVVSVFASMGSLLSGVSEEGIGGNEIRDLFENVRTIAFLSIIPGIMMAVGYALILYKPAKNWGRPLLGVFLGLSLLTSIGAAALTYSLTGDVIEGIDPDREDYDADDMEDLQTDVTMNGWMAGLLRVPEYLIYLAVAIGAFLNVKKMEEEMEPRLDDRLYNIEL
ncbi:MAG: hypothetical protein JW939_08250 [Candidatus Thermoplasmatota archaeon]|nr:hypothetical protein [Candidatus Thermoplasmatota archaeon]